MAKWGFEWGLRITSMIKELFLNAIALTAVRSFAQMHSLLNSSDLLSFIILIHSSAARFLTN